MGEHATVNSYAGVAGLSTLQGISQRAADQRYGNWGKPKAAGMPRHHAVTFLSPSNPETLLNAARKAHADLLIAAQITLHGRKGKSQEATLVMRLVDVERATELWHSDKLTTSRVTAAKRRGGEDPGFSIADAAITYIDANISLSPMPKLAREVVKKRARTIAERDNFELGVLAELKYYERTGSLSSEDAHACYVKLLGEEDAERFRSRSIKVRHEAVEPLVLEQ